MVEEIKKESIKVGDLTFEVGYIMNKYLEVRVFDNEEIFSYEPSPINKESNGKKYLKKMIKQASEGKYDAKKAKRLCKAIKEEIQKYEVIVFGVNI